MNQNKSDGASERPLDLIVMHGTGEQKMDRCEVLHGPHEYVGNGPRMATIGEVQATPDAPDYNLAKMTLWTEERLCTGCGKTAMFNQAGIEVHNV